MPKPLTQTTGRRKAAIARVRLRPGNGTITVNGRPVEDYFPSATHRMVLTEPLRLVEKSEDYNIDAGLDGGGISGQAGALRLGIARALAELEPDLRAPLKRAGLPDQRPSRERAEEVRAQEGPQSAPVLQALVPSACEAPAP